MVRDDNFFTGVKYGKEEGNKGKSTGKISIKMKKPLKPKPSDRINNLGQIETNWEILEQTRNDQFKST